ncbi:MAG: OB-fold domain-containing protein [Gammaproteobacteria bacterium]|nr:OB-fold domain-containing protein [Gammaproteobacteria bacterium]
MTDGATVRRYVPRTTGLHRDFYLHTLAGGLHLQACEDCGERQHPPRYYCRACRSKALSFKAATGTGTIYSFTVSHFTHDPGWAAAAPFGTVVVETDEGPRIVASWLGANDDIRIGTRVRIVIEPVNEAFGMLQAEAL